MKKHRIRFLLCLLACALLAGCGAEKEQPAAQVDLAAFYDTLAEEYGWSDESMMDLDSEMLEMYYPGLGDIPARQLLAKAPVMSFGVNEYVFMQCQTEEDAARAAEILRQRIDAQAGGDAFYPETVDQWKAARVITNGTYAALIASGEHQTEIEDAFNSQFSD